MIECTNLFPPAEWAAAHLHGPDMVRINIQYANHVYCVHVNIDEIAPFLERVRKAQERQKQQGSPSDPAAA